MQENVSTIVLNWNGWRDTSVCISSLLRQTYTNQRVIVVDNGSTDDSVSRLRQEFPQVTLIENGANLGFSAGCNVGIRAALAGGADFVWLLNSDAVADPNALRTLVETAKRDSRIAAVGSAIYFMNEAEGMQAWGGGRVNFWLGRSRHVVSPVPDDHLHYLTGASLLLRGAALESVGLFDEGFFFYWEDADLGFRLRRAKWKLAVAGDSQIRHKQSSSLRDKEDVLDAYFNQSANRFFRKHAAVPQIPLYMGVGLRFMKRLLAGDWERARAVWTGFRSAYP